MLIATSFAILTQVESHSAKLIEMPVRPKRVGILINKAEFERTNEVRHWGTVMLMDVGHDWDWRKGQFSFWGGNRDELVDVVIVYEEEHHKFCVSCGTPVFSNCECQGE